jgi:hypothetical protein
VYNKFESANIVILIKIFRLEWLGHVIRMDCEGQYRSHWKTNQEERKKKEDLD